MQGADEGHDHHTPRLRRGLLLAALAVTPLPSPIAPLSSTPPLAGGAFAGRDNVRHRIDARTSVRVLVDENGKPFSVTATQRLDVRVLGDYFFTIGAPVRDVERAPGSASDPGLRAASIVWAGFDPGRRVLAARATLDPERAGPGLPARLERRRLVNTTAITVAAYTAEAEKPALLQYLSALRTAVGAGKTPPSGVAELRTRARSTKVHVVVPLRVSGTVGTARIATTVTGTLELPPGKVDLRVEPVAPTVAWSPTDSGRALLDLAIRTTLTVARHRQYETFLGNPDPSGTSETSYRFVTARPPAVAAPVATANRRSVRRSVVLAAGLLAAAAVALALWVRS